MLILEQSIPMYVCIYMGGVGWGMTCLVMVPSHPMNSCLHWDMGRSEVRPKPWTLGYVPPANPECYLI